MSEFFTFWNQVSDIKHTWELFQIHPLSDMFSPSSDRKAALWHSEVQSRAFLLTHTPRCQSKSESLLERPESEPRLGLTLQTKWGTSQREDAQKDGLSDVKKYNRRWKFNNSGAVMRLEENLLSQVTLPEVGSVWVLHFIFKLKSWWERKKKKSPYKVCLFTIKANACSECF